MLMDDLVATIQEVLTSNLVNLIGALAILVVGWIVALVLSNQIRKLAKKTGFYRSFCKWVFGGDMDREPEIDKWLGRIIYVSIMVISFFGFFKILGVSSINQPLMDLTDAVFGSIGRLVPPAILLLVAWIVASILKFIIIRFTKKIKFDEKLGTQIDPSQKREVQVSTAFAETVYWLVFLLFLPPILNELNLEGLMDPINDLVDQLLGYLPNLLGAVVIFFVGWFIAKIIQRILVNVLGSFGVDNIGQKVGLKNILGEQRLSEVLGLLAYVLILIPVLISSLNALQLEAITEPASDMLNKILQSFPSIFAAGLVLFLAWLIGKVFSDLAARFLEGVGFNNILQKIGFSGELQGDAKSPSQIAGVLVLFSVMLFASIESLNLLGFETLSEIVNQFTMFMGRVLLGLGIFSLGLYVANFAAKSIATSTIVQSKILSEITRVAILILAGAMALREIGIAEEIVSLTFGIAFGGVAIAFGLAFGLGGKDIASDQIKKMIKSFKGES